NIKNKSIYSEAIDHDPSDLPVYHVHGFLPRTATIPTENELVFSEDAYHSQFIEAFSWSNLVQLNKLTQNTCLLVGISLTDPNMRRLLDVAWRKNPSKTPAHFIAKRLPKSGGGDMIDQVSKLLEEQDANALGLNVVWMEDYDELPGILNNVATYERT
ncbi:MAG: SIR2 family protein, partial [Pirellula sp.]